MRKMFSEKQLEKISKEAVQSGLNSGEVVAPSPKFQLFVNGSVDSTEIDLPKNLVEGLYYIIVEDTTASETLVSGFICIISDIESYYFLTANTLSDYSNIELPSFDVINLPDWTEGHEGIYKIYKL